MDTATPTPAPPSGRSRSSTLYGSSLAGIALVAGLVGWVAGRSAPEVAPRSAKTPAPVVALPPPVAEVAPAAPSLAQQVTPPAPPVDTPVVDAAVPVASPPPPAVSTTTGGRARVRISAAGPGEEGIVVEGSLKERWNGNAAAMFRNPVSGAPPDPSRLDGERRVWNGRSHGDDSGPSSGNPVTSWYEPYFPYVPAWRPPEGYFPGRGADPFPPAGNDPGGRFRHDPAPQPRPVPARNSAGVAPPPTGRPRLR